MLISWSAYQQKAGHLQSAEGYFLGTIVADDAKATFLTCGYTEKSVFNVNLPLERKENALMGIDVHLYVHMNCGALYAMHGRVMSAD